MKAEDRELELVKDAAYQTLGIRTVKTTLNLEEVVFVCQRYHQKKLQSLKEEVKKLKEYARNENWSMVEIQAEKIGYFFED